MPRPCMAFALLLLLLTLTFKDAFARPPSKFPWRPTTQHPPSLQSPCPNSTKTTVWPVISEPKNSSARPFSERTTLLPKIPPTTLVGRIRPTTKGPKIPSTTSFELAQPTTKGLKIQSTTLIGLAKPNPKAPNTSFLSPAWSAISVTTKHSMSSASKPDFTPSSSKEFHISGEVGVPTTANSSVTVPPTTHPSSFAAPKTNLVSSVATAETNSSTISPATIEFSSLIVPSTTNLRAAIDTSSTAWNSIRPSATDSIALVGITVPSSSATLSSATSWQATPTSSAVTSSATLSSATSWQATPTSSAVTSSTLWTSVATSKPGSSFRADSNIESPSATNSVTVLTTTVSPSVSPSASASASAAPMLSNAEIRNVTERLAVKKIYPNDRENEDLGDCVPKEDDPCVNFNEAMQDPAMKEVAENHDSGDESEDEDEYHRQLRLGLGLGLGIGGPTMIASGVTAFSTFKQGKDFVSFLKKLDPNLANRVQTAIRDTTPPAVIVTPPTPPVVDPVVPPAPPPAPPVVDPAVPPGPPQGPGEDCPTTSELYDPSPDNPYRFESAHLSGAPQPLGEIESGPSRSPQPPREEAGPSREAKGKGRDPFPFERAGFKPGARTPGGLLVPSRNPQPPGRNRAPRPPGEESGSSRNPQPPRACRNRAPRPPGKESGPSRNPLPPGRIRAPQPPINPQPPERTDPLWMSQRPEPVRPETLINKPREIKSQILQRDQAARILNETLYRPPTLDARRKEPEKDAKIERAWMEDVMRRVETREDYDALKRVFSKDRIAKHELDRRLYKLSTLLENRPKTMPSIQRFLCQPDNSWATPEALKTLEFLPKWHVSTEVEEALKEAEDAVWHIKNEDLRQYQYRRLQHEIVFKMKKLYKQYYDAWLEIPNKPPYETLMNEWDPAKDQRFKVVNWLWEYESDIFRADNKRYTLEPREAAPGKLTWVQPALQKHYPGYVARDIVEALAELKEPGEEVLQVRQSPEEVAWREEVTWEEVDPKLKKALKKKPKTPKWNDGGPEDLRQPKWHKPEPWKPDPIWQYNDDHQSWRQEKTNTPSYTKEHWYHQW